MAKKNLILGVAAGVALLSVAAILLYRKRKLASSPDVERSFDNLIHDGKRLANKSRHKAQHLVSTIRHQG